jgi:tetratricopeptide (TPR) repeat protein
VETLAQAPDAPSAAEQLPLLAAAVAAPDALADAALDASLRSARADALRLRGNASFKAGEWAQAAVEYTQSLAEEESGGVRCNRAAAFLKLGRHEQALADAEAAAQAQPGASKPLFRKGLALHALRRYAEAGAALSAAAALEPASAQVRPGFQRQSALV